MKCEAYVLIYLESENGIPISLIPNFCVDDESSQSYVISARGNNLYFRNQGISTYNSAWFVHYFDSDLKKWRQWTLKELFHNYPKLNEAQKEAFWQKLQDENEDEEKPLEALHNATRAFDRFNETLLNRALILLHFEEDDRKYLDSEINGYLSSLFEGSYLDPSMFKRISVGGTEVIADYLLTRFLSDRIPDTDPESHDFSNTGSFDPLSEQPIRKIGHFDFSYHRSLEHLHPYYYFEDEWCYQKSLLDDFYYRLNHEPVDAIQESLTIPEEIDRILPNEVRNQLPQIFIDKINASIDIIKYEVFGMQPPPQEPSSPDIRLSNAGGESLQDYLGFDGPFSDSELGD